MSPFHIIAISVRRAVGDRAYHLVESFEAGSLPIACAKHATYRRAGVFSSVLRDGRTGERYSVSASREVVEDEVRREQQSREAELDRFYDDQMEAAKEQAA